MDEATRDAAYDALLSSLADGAFVCDADGRIERCNEEMARIFGYEVHELVGSSIDLLMPEARRMNHAKLRAAWLAAPRSRPMRTLQDIQGQRKNNELIEIEIGLVPFDADGPLRVTGIVRDVTERKRAAARLLRETTRHRVIANFSAAILEMRDLTTIAHTLFDALESEALVTHAVLAEHDRAGRIFAHLASSKNTERRRTLAMPPQSGPGTLAELGTADCLTGKSVLIADWTTLANPFLQAWTRVGLRTSVSLPIVIGERRLVLTLGRDAVGSIDASDLVFFETIASHFRLAAAHAELDAQIAAAQQSMAREQRLAALGQMAAGIIHDVNNAVSPILSFSRMLLDEEPHLSATAIEALQMIELSGTDMHNIARRLQTFVVRRSGPVESVPIDLNQMAAKTLEMTRTRWGTATIQRGGTITGSLDLAPVAPVIRAGETELRESLVNLIFNAVDALTEGGELTLRTGTTDSGRPFVEVVDTGTGMDEEVVNRCVDPFFTTKGAEGSGLGLSMVFAMMRKYEGEMTVQSVVGVGTAIRLAFPDSVADSPLQTELAPTVDQMPANREPSDAQAAPRILVVDDDLPVRQVVVMMLNRLGHVVVDRPNGQTALAELERMADLGTPYALLVTDLAMPGMSGRELTQHTRRVSPRSRVLMLTAMTGMEGTSRVLQEGVDRLMAKPIEPRELARVVSELLGQWRIDATRG